MFERFLQNCFIDLRKIWFCQINDGLALALTYLKGSDKKVQKSLIFFTFLSSSPLNSSPPLPFSGSSGAYKALANFSAMVDLPTRYFLHVGHVFISGFFRQFSHRGWPSLHCQILEQQKFEVNSKEMNFTWTMLNAMKC